MSRESEFFQSPEFIFIVCVSAFLLFTLFFVKKKITEKILKEVSFYTRSIDEKIIYYGKYWNTEQYYYSGGLAIFLACAMEFYIEEMLEEYILVFLIALIFFICLLAYNICCYGKMIFLTDKSLILTSFLKKGYINEIFKLSEIKDSGYRLECSLITKWRIEIPYLILCFKDGYKKQISKLSNLDEINNYILKIIKKKNNWE